MTLTCTFKDGSKKDVRVPLEPPLSGYEDVKPRLLEMKALAQEGLGMVGCTNILSHSNIHLIAHDSQIKTPRISTFRFPTNALVTLVLYALVFYIIYSPKSTSSLFAPAQFIHSKVGRAPVYILMTALVVHILEASYTFTLCRKHTGFFVGVSAFASTAVTVLLTGL